MEHLITVALAHHELLFGLDKVFTDLADWRVAFIVGLVVDGKAQVPLALGCTTVTLLKGCLKRVKLVVKSQLLVFLDVFPGKNTY